MSFSFRLLLAFLIVITVAVMLFFNTAMSQLELAIAQSAEETMVDTANLLAELVEEDFREQELEGFESGFGDYRQRSVAARIFSVTKETPSFRIYITDDSGIVVFDSEDAALGEDYSQWNDVFLTLRGRYGARTTPTDPEDLDTSVLHVAAPIHMDGQIAGVLTVAKSKLSLVAYRDDIRVVLLQSFALLLAVSVADAFALVWWFTGSVRRLTDYATEVSADIVGERHLEPPVIREPELDQLGRAMSSMHASLEGRTYVEDYIRGLTHELKSPIAAIRGAMELLEDSMSDQDRRRFLDNIDHESRRLHELTERLLDLAQLEHQRGLEHTTDCSLIEIATAVAESLKPLAYRGEVDLKVSGGAQTLKGDSLLLTTAVRNLVQNAIRWSPGGSQVEIELCASSVRVVDHGPGVPDYALGQLCERFYSLPDPATGRKSSGLGLSFVRQIMVLHGGSVRFENLANGFMVILEFSTDSTQNT